MIRDITVIISVLISVVSVGFGLYKNIEAGNAKGYAYEQAYRVLGVVQQSNIGGSAKASIMSAALGTFGTPPPVIDLSRSSADAGTELCNESRRASCASLAVSLANANDTCRIQKSSTCSPADDLKADILEQGCFVCF